MIEPNTGPGPRPHLRSSVLRAVYLAAVPSGDSIIPGMLEDDVSVGTRGAGTGFVGDTPRDKPSFSSSCKGMVQQQRKAHNNKSYCVSNIGGVAVGGKESSHQVKNAGRASPHPNVTILEYPY